LLGEIAEKMQVQFKEIMALNTDLNINIEILQTALADIETYSDVIDKSWHDFRRETLQKILDSLKQENITLSDKDKNDFLTESGWGELIKQVRAEQITLPKHINFTKPDYAAYFELKRCIAISHASKVAPVSANDSIHQDLKKTITQFGLRTDAVITAALRQFETYYQLSVKEAESILKQGAEKKKILIQLHRAAEKAVALQVDDAESLRDIALRTFATPEDLLMKIEGEPVIKTNVSPAAEGGK